MTGKGAFLVTTAKPERTSPVTRGKWVMTNILGMSPPDPPADVPPLPPRAADPNAKEPSMRQKMMDHRVRPDCVQCHQLMDPIGFALETFDGIGLVRTHDEGTPVDPKARLFDNTQIDGPAACASGSPPTTRRQFVAVASEKLLDLRPRAAASTIATCRSCASWRAKRGTGGNRFSALVLGVVKSQPFQMNTRSVPPATTTAVGRHDPEPGRN